MKHPGTQIYLFSGSQYRRISNCYSSRDYIIYCFLCVSLSTSWLWVSQGKDLGLVSLVFIIMKWLIIINVLPCWDSALSTLHGLYLSHFIPMVILWGIYICCHYFTDIQTATLSPYSSSMSFSLPVFPRQVNLGNSCLIAQTVQAFSWLQQVSSQGPQDSLCTALKPGVP